MTSQIDSSIVAAYLVFIFLAGYLVSRRQRAATATDFLTGGRRFTWRQTGITLVAMAFDPAYMGMAGLGFIWGLYIIQWNAVHIWFTSWFAAMFLIPIYWRSKITTTPEYLEKRFNVQCRVFFSVVMTIILIVTLTSGLYLGSLLLKTLLGWSLVVSVLFISAVVGSYVILGGLQTVLILDVYQGVFLLVTLAVIAVRAVYEVGGIEAFFAVQATGNAGNPLTSLIPPNDWNLQTPTFFPIPAVLTWATVAGLSWLACNFGMAQRLLAARSEQDAQKSLLLLAVLATMACLGTFIIGVAMRSLKPDLVPDEAFMNVMLTMFPVGVRGVLVAGMMAALLSSADGMLTASSGLLTEDIYLRFLRPAATAKQQKRVTRWLEAATLILSLSLIPLLMQSESAVTFVQNFYGDVLGVVVALYIVGMFSVRATAKSAFSAMLLGIIFAVALDVFTDLNFAYVGAFSFLFALLATLLLSRFETPLPRERLANLTIHTLADAPGPWVGLTAWPNLGKWAFGLSAAWFGVTWAWELAVRASQ